jgi:hypothetical protein
LTNLKASEEPLRRGIEAARLALDRFAKQRAKADSRAASRRAVRVLGDYLTRTAGQRNDGSGCPLCGARGDYCCPASIVGAADSGEGDADAGNGRAER